MPYEVIQPPTSDDKVVEVGKEIIDAAIKLGRPVDVEGFLQAWYVGLRVIAERDDKGVITGLAFVNIGQRWLFLDNAALVVWHKCENEKAMLDYITMICNAMGVQCLYHDSEEPIEKTDRIEKYVVTKHILRR